MHKITQITGREILDCRGMPTVQVDVWVDERFLGRADAPAGRSTGAHEAQELRDGGARFAGQGVRKAVANVNEAIGSALVGLRATNQRTIDGVLIELDGTPDKSRLGANAIVATSVAAARAAAAAYGLPLYTYLNANAHVLPLPQFNLINGGRHASNDLDFQEVAIMPYGAQDLMEALQIATETSLALRELLLRNYGKQAVNLGDEGGFAPPIADPSEALDVLRTAVRSAGYADKVQYGLDCAATHLFDPGSDLYTIADHKYDRSQLTALYERLVKEFDVVSFEDPLHEDDFEGFRELTARLGVQIIGDDLFASNPERVRRGAAIGAANALLLKVNQVGTLSEALDAATMAMRHGYSVMVSERSGETEDAFIADLAVAINAGQIKTGAPVRGERTAKYNALLRIEEELGGTARFAGREYRMPI